MARRKRERNSLDANIAIPDGIKLTAASEQQWNRLVIGLPLERGPRLLFVTLDSPKLRRPLASDLAKKLTQAGVAVEVIDLTQPLAQPLQEILRQAQERPKANAYFVLGLDRSLLSGEHSSAAFADLNFHRERIPQAARAPLVFWLDTSTFKSLALRASDFMAWRAGEFHLIEDEGPMSEAIQRYRQHVIDRFSKLTLYSVTSDKPLAVDLEQVFIKLEATEGGVNARGLYDSWLFLNDQAQNDLFSLQITDQGFRRDTLADLSNFSRRRRTWTDIKGWITRGSHLRTSTPRNVSLSEAIMWNEELSIIGAPGSGKTTALKYVALTFARRQAMERLNVDEDLLPVYIALRDFSNAQRQLDLSSLKQIATRLPQYLAEFHRDVFPHLALPADFFEALLKKKRCILLLDGFDEVADPRQRTLIALEMVACATQFSGNRFVLTSRPRGYEIGARQLLSNRFAECTINDFDDEQIKSYAKSWYLAVTLDLEGDTPTARDRAATRATDLLRAVQNDRVRPLATNPLLLSILALIHQRGNRLPQRRVALYEECVEFLLGFWRQVQGGEAARELADVGGLTRNEKRTLLEPVALWLHERGETGIEVTRSELEQTLVDEFHRLFGETVKDAAGRATEFVDIIVEHAGLLVEREAGLFAFSHLTFQEFLAARALSDRLDYLDSVSKHLHNPWWREVILLLVGYLSGPCTRRSREETAEVLNTIRNAGSSLEKALHRDLLFAFRCLCDVDPLGVDDDLRRSFATEVLELYRRTNNDAFRREVLDLFVYAAPTPVGRILKSSLMSIADDSEPLVRGVAVQAIGAIGGATPSPEIIDRLLESSRDAQQPVIASAVGALANLGRAANTPQVIARLLEIIQEPSSLAFEAARALSTIAAGRTNSSLVLRLVELMRSANEAAGFAALSVIGRLSAEIGIPQLIEPLLEMTKEDDPDLRGRAVVALGRLRSAAATSKIMNRLIELTADSDELVRIYVAGALGDIGTVVTRAEIMSGLFTLSRDEAFVVRVAASEALGKLVGTELSSDVKERLFEISRDVSGDVRAEATGALGALAAKGARQNILARLIELTSDSEANVRVNALLALGKVGTESRTEVVPILLDKIQDSDYRMRRMSGYALGKLGLDGDASKVIATLLSQTSSDLVMIRATAAYTLGRIGAGTATTQVFRRLVKMIRDPAKEVRSSASEALLRLGTSSLTPELRSQMSRFLRSSRDYCARANVAMTLGQSPARLSKPQAKQLIAFWTECLRIHDSYTVGGSYQKLSTVAYEQLKELAAFGLNTRPKGQRSTAERV